MKRLDYKLANGKPFAIQYAETFKGVITVKSKTENYFITISPDIHFTLSQMRFGFFNFPQEFGELDLNFEPSILFSFESTGSDLVNIMRASKQHLIYYYGNSVFTDYKPKDEIEMYQFKKIFNSDEMIELNTSVQKEQEALQLEAKRKEAKEKQKQLEKYQAELELKLNKEMKKFAKENNIPLPKEKARGKDKFLWKMGS